MRSYKVIGQEQHERWGKLYIVQFPDIDYVPVPHCGLVSQRVIADELIIEDLPPGQWLIYAAFRNCDALHLVLCEKDSVGQYRLTC